VTRFASRLSPRAVLAGATVVAAVATAGSLWLSLGLGLVPCRLCWYQRVLMYPLVVVLGVAALEDRPGVWRTALPLAALGTGVAAYHSLLQVAAVSGSTCSVAVGCASVQLALAGGLVTIPRLSLVAFLLVTAGLVAVAAGRTAA
jgi:disulfide bond formation protein DsbB